MRYVYNNLKTKLSIVLIVHKRKCESSCIINDQLQARAKIHKTNVENPVNSKKSSYFPKPNCPPYPTVLIFNLIMLCFQ